MFWSSKDTGRREFCMLQNRSHGCHERGGTSGSKLKRGALNVKRRVSHSQLGGGRRQGARGRHSYFATKDTKGNRFCMGTAGGGQMQLSAHIRNLPFEKIVWVPPSNVIF